LKELNDADLIIDFSGDIYGDNATSAKFIESNVELIFARILNKKIAMLMGSPGPFKSIWRQIVAKSNLNNIALLTNRENKSTEFLEYIGINGKHIYSAGCPSVLFKKENDENMRQIFEIEGLNEIRSKPLIGLIICGWNMPEAPYNKWPRSDDEYNYFIKIIDFLIRQKNVDICLMSHQNGTNKAGKLTKQNDHNIIDKLLELIGDKYTSKQLFTLQGLYTAAESKAIISKFDILVSGRIHGAVQGMSQCIPTAIIDYGHEPKAHKLKGFADIYKVGNLIIEPNNYEKSIYVLDELIENSQVYHESLKQRVPEVKKLALKNLSLLESYYNL
jgi:colanic acid/amylovoran biosynthesis protein